MSIVMRIIFFYGIPLVLVYTKWRLGKHKNRSKAYQTILPQLTGSSSSCEGQLHGLRVDSIHLSRLGLLIRCWYCLYTVFFFSPNHSLLCAEVPVVVLIASFRWLTSYRCYLYPDDGLTSAGFVLLALRHIWMLFLFSRTFQYQSC